MLGISELAILLIVVTLVFGAKKLPELARSMGKSARILKSEAKAMKSDQASDPSAAAGASSPGPAGPQVIRAAPGGITGPPAPRPDNDIPRT
ncbi:Sec-independent protein translocase subunit TatA [Streptomyces sp. NPDC015350]|uniref:Sec-independent protein translocase subunit TatA n=1 Tax=Streptomyces sp. NPDC015350 TaxID=3364955 RepID=UPI0036FF10A8